MHPNKAFRQHTSEHNLTFARACGFGILTVCGPAGPLASHIPFILSNDGSRFGAHIVRSNPMVRVLKEKQPALMVISGPDGYISPDWYDLDDQVPTWNYVAVHLYGTLQQLPEARLKPHLEEMSEAFEKQLSPKPVWKLDKVDGEILSRMQRSIVPIEFMIDRVEGTWKLGQNKSPEAQRNAAQEIVQSPLGNMLENLGKLMNDEVSPV